jgi:hypothetical protein
MHFLYDGHQKVGLEDIYTGLFFWWYMPEWHSGTYLKEQISKKAKIK